MREGIRTVYYLKEPSDNKPMWVNQSIDGLAEAAMKQKFTVLEAMDVDAVPGASGSVILIGHSRPWFTSRIAEARSAHLRPIMIGGIPSEYGEDVSGVIYDVSTAISNAVMYFHDAGRDRIALLNICYGNSIDVKKLEAFIDAGNRLGLRFSDADIFESKPDSLNPIDNFWKNVDKYDGAICANDACGVLVLSTARSMGIKVPEDLFVCGMGDFHICQYSTPTLSSITRCYYEAGSLAFGIWKRFFTAGWGISSFVITTQSRMIPRGSTAFHPVPGEGISGFADSIDAHDINLDYDLSIRRMRAIQNCLSSCDDIDLKIIFGVLRGESNETISEKISVSSGTVAYRLKHIYSVAHVETKSELERLFRSMSIDFAQQEEM